MLIVLALPFTEGAAVITGSGWRRGGGPAACVRSRMTRAAARRTARGLGERSSRWSALRHPPPGHYEPGAREALREASSRTVRGRRADRPLPPGAGERTARDARQLAFLTFASQRPGALLPSLFDIGRNVPSPHRARGDQVRPCRGRGELLPVGLGVVRLVVA